MATPIVNEQWITTFIQNLQLASTKGVEGVGFREAVLRDDLEDLKKQAVALVAKVKAGNQTVGDVDRLQALVEEIYLRPLRYKRIEARNSRLLAHRRMHLLMHVCEGDESIGASSGVATGTSGNLSNLSSLVAAQKSN